MILPGTGRGTGAAGGGALPQTVPPVVYTARRLRRDMSLPEVLLWKHLRGAPNGMKFRRQHPVGNYVVDFYCRVAHLAVEIDGMAHDGAERIASDERRTKFLEERGLRVVRLAASQVLKDAARAAQEIIALAGAPLHHQPAAGGPPPRAGED